MMFCTFIEVGFKEIISKPKAKKVLKIKPITASSLSLEIDLIHKMESAAKMPAKKAPKA